MGTGGSFPGVRWPGREADHSPPSSADGNAWSYTSIPNVFIAWCLTKDKGNFIFTLSTTPWRCMWEWRYSTTNSFHQSRWRWVVSFTLRLLYYTVRAV